MNPHRERSRLLRVYYSKMAGVTYPWAMASPCCLCITTYLQGNLHSVTLAGHYAAVCYPLGGLWTQRQRVLPCLCFASDSEPVVLPQCGTFALSGKRTPTSITSPATLRTHLGWVMKGQARKGCWESSREGRREVILISTMERGFAAAWHRHLSDYCHRKDIILWWVLQKGLKHRKLSTSVTCCWNHGYNLHPSRFPSLLGIRLYGTLVTFAATATQFVDGSFWFQVHRYHQLYRRSS